MSAEIEFPQHYQGIYQRVEGKYRPLLGEALKAIRAIPVSDDLRPFLAFQTWENPQPSFMLFPLMFLATAETTGGITQRHRDYLPTIMLASELCAVADDTIDRTPQRSGRATFAAEFGEASALPMACALSSLVLAQSRDSARLFGAALSFFTDFFGLELWERENTYPGFDLFSSWLEHRYAQAIVATEYVLNASLLIANDTVWPRAAVTAFSQIGQDVDDIVNVVEYRDIEGENDDIQGGIVTRPLIYALEAVPSLRDDLTELWDAHRSVADLDLSIQQSQVRRSEIARATRPLYSKVRATVIEHGVPLAIRQCMREFHAAVRETPRPLRPLMRDLAMAFLDRLRRCRYVVSDGDLTSEQFAQAG